MNRKKKMLIMSIASLAISGFISISAVTYSLKDRNVLAQPLTTSVTEVSFILKEYDGNLALFRGDSPTPYKKLDVPVSYLTEYDQELVKIGIVKNSESELQSLIEDLTS